MWPKEIGKCYHLWINPKLLEKLTHVVCCFFFQDNGKQTVFVSYKQQRWSLFIDRYLFNVQLTHYLQKDASATSSICGKWSKMHVVVWAKHEKVTMNCFSLLVWLGLRIRLNSNGKMNANSEPSGVKGKQWNKGKATSTTKFRIGLGGRLKWKHQSLQWKNCRTFCSHSASQDTET